MCRKKDTQAGAYEQCNITGSKEWQLRIASRIEAPPVAGQAGPFGRLRAHAMESTMLRLCGPATDDAGRRGVKRRPANLGIADRDHPVDRVTAPFTDGIVGIPKRNRSKPDTGALRRSLRHGGGMCASRTRGPMLPGTAACGGGRRPGSGVGMPSAPGWIAGRGTVSPSGRSDTPEGTVRPDRVGGRVDGRHRREGPSRRDQWRKNGPQAIGRP